MAILQRTPPARRPMNGAEGEPATSSPSRSRLIRSSERQPAIKADSYVFPSLESMAAERQAAMSLAPRNSPIITLSSRARSSVDASGGSLGTSSANSRKVMGGQVGRNGPILSATVARSHPAIGDSSRTIQSPHAASKSLIPRRAPSLIKAAPLDQLTGSALSRDPSPANPFQSGSQQNAAHGANSASEDAQVANNSTLTVEKGTFEAQMERALASGADPFQDRKKALMRGEARMPVAQHEEPIVNGPRRSFLQSAELVNVSERATLATDAAESRASTPKAAPPQSPLLRTSILPSMQSPASQSSKVIVAKLKAEIEEKMKQIEQARSEAAQAQRTLKEKEKLDRQQRDMIRGLEKRLHDEGSKNRETNSIQLRLVALEWESLREKCSYIMARGEMSREREIEAIISRNEVSYMDARRAESELDLKEMQIEAESVRNSLKEAEKQRLLMKRNLRDAQREKVALDGELAAVQSSESKAQEGLSFEKQKRLDLEDELKILREELAKEEAENRKLKQRQPPSPVRRELPVAEMRKSSPVRRVPKSDDKENVSPSKDLSVTTSKTTRVMSETVRQSPRKKLSAFVKSTSAKFQSTVMRQSDGITDDEQDVDELSQAEMFKEVMKPKVVTKSKQIAIKAKKTLTEDESEGEEEAKEVILPKKKGGILSRAKITNEKKVSVTSSKRKSDSRIEEAQMIEMEHDVQQTPMIPTKKRKSKTEIVRAVEENDESMDAEATPVVKPKSKQVTASRLVEETTKTPVIRSKKRKEDVERRESIEASTSVGKRSSVVAAGEEELPKKKRKRILKQTTNIANNFLNCNGDGEGGLDPELNLPLQLSPLKGAPTSSTTLGTRGGASNRLYGR